MQFTIRTGIRRALMAAVMGVGACILSGGALAATPADTLVIGKPADPQTLDPAVTIDNNDWTVTYPAYQRLMRYKQVDGHGSTEVEGDLAASWSASPDNLVWTFKLHDGQKFSDGTPVDAQAVKQSFERLLAKKQGPSEAFPADMKVDATDALTVRFTLQKPFAPFLYTLANNGASIVNPKAMQRDDADAWLSGHTAGSGPYQLVSWQKGQSLVLERNPNYAGSKKPTLDKFVVKIVPEASARRLQLQKGDLDVAEELPVDQLQALKKDQAVHVAEFPSLRVTYLYLNNARGPLQNADLRRAVVAALDYQGIVDGIMMGQAKQMRGPIPEGMWGHDADLPQPKQDVAAAKALVEKAGGVKSPLLLRYSTQDPAWEPIALTVQANLTAIGVPVKLEKLANATLRENLGQGNFDISIGNWSPDFADPYMFTSYWFDSDKKGLAGNRSFYANPQVDQWLREAATLSEQAPRVALYKQVQEQVVKDAAYAYLYQKNYQAGLGANVKGFVFNPMLERVFNVADMTK
ncbi:ABC transporter substrate-binding protein [Castellaniella daejeonensis]|jgi:peptide/nickel transport system substrate-binding protein|uniref:ABC transporter substrate-binding protein n=1 Tax=Castellaniella daejeonensis TaxID=659013 RepID=A0ABP3D940_9BURK|nr:ABC transporter substrate-binding protein [Castellaniella sp.]HET8703643.1 ABC transporter substrate-binding protein [Castellaniella sp.]